MVVANTNGGVFHFLSDLSPHRGEIPYWSMYVADPQMTAVGWDIRNHALQEKQKDDEQAVHKSGSYIINTGWIPKCSPTLWLCET